MQSTEMHAKGLFKLSMVVRLLRMKRSRSIICYTLLLPLMGCAPNGAETIAASLSFPTVLAPSPQMLQKSVEPMPVSLDLGTYRWSNRLLLVFAPGEDAPAYQQQMQHFVSETAGVEERDLRLIEMLAEGTSRFNGEPVSQIDAEVVRSRYQITPDTFAVILIGKDGTLKRRDRTPVAAAVIFREIDAMPMRQREMQQ